MGRRGRVGGLLIRDQRCKANGSPKGSFKGVSGGDPLCNLLIVM